MSTLSVTATPGSPRDDVVKLYKAFKGFGCDTSAVINILAHRDASQRALIRQEYEPLYSEDLLHRLAKELSGKLELLVALVGAQRYEGFEVDKNLADNDAKALYKAGEKKLGTNEDMFIKIFSQRSRAQLAAIDSAYHSMYGHSLEKAIKKETSGNFAYALLTLLRCADNPAKYFAKVLRKAMKGLGTDDTTLIRVIVTRVEIDMQYIKAEYEKKYKKSLVDAVHSETSGDYRKFLLALLGPKH
ncbi:annexin D5 isoform X2 [Spinacia oleracea]|uniref:Annexin n=1 Tax=Spinacia oleracea TaxID=3562 RepID=A0ABM3RTN9_SPIOL|nr:annexin D5-like isoform X2 [Spinacia oleracea]